MLFIPYPHVSVVLFYLCMPQNICMFLHLTANVLVCVYLDIYNVLHSFLQIPNSINHHFSLLWRTSVCISWGVSVKTYYLNVWRYHYFAFLILKIISLDIEFLVGWQIFHSSCFMWYFYSWYFYLQLFYSFPIWLKFNIFGQVFSLCLYYNYFILSLTVPISEYFLILILLIFSLLSNCLIFSYILLPSFMPHLIYKRHSFLPGS